MKARSCRDSLTLIVTQTATLLWRNLLDCHGILCWGSGWWSQVGPLSQRCHVQSLLSCTTLEAVLKNNVSLYLPLVLGFFQYQVSASSDCVFPGFQGTHSIAFTWILWCLVRVELMHLLFHRWMSCFSRQLSNFLSVPMHLGIMYSCDSTYIQI